MGNQVQRIWDVGVAGIHRVLAERALLQGARVIIVAAGMEGALPSVVGGLVSVPVVAVPTSIGYGASFGGVAALLGMLNSCASNVTVVNIDNGFGAGFVASLINRKVGSAGGLKRVLRFLASFQRASRKRSLFALLITCCQLIPRNIGNAPNSTRER